MGEILKIKDGKIAIVNNNIIVIVSAAFCIIIPTFSNIVCSCFPTSYISPASLLGRFSFLSSGSSTTSDIEPGCSSQYEVRTRSRVSPRGVLRDPVCLLACLPACRRPSQVGFRRMHRLMCIVCVVSTTGPETPRAVSVRRTRESVSDDERRPACDDGSLLLGSD